MLGANPYLENTSCCVDDATGHNLALEAHTERRTQTATTQRP